MHRSNNVHIIFVYLDRNLCKCVHILNSINECRNREKEINDHNEINKWILYNEAA